MENEEQRLVAQSVNGDLRAFERLYRSHVSRVYGLCVRLTESLDEAEDVTQETFIKAWQRLADFRGQSALSTWLHRIAFNEVMARKRRQARASAQLSVAASDGRAVASDPLQSDELEQAIRRLPDRARQVFVLQKVYGYTHAETAAIMDIAVGTCKAQAHRAARLLAEMLDEQSAAAAPASAKAVNERGEGRD